MAIYKRDIVDINLETGNIHRSFLKHSIGYLDQAADHFGIRVLRNGEPVDLTGVTVQGIFMPPQGNPIAITTGNIIEENVAEVVLPQACYNYDGQFCLSIKLVDATNAITGTMRIVDGMVDNTHASGTVAPTETVPTYQEILSVYADMVTALVTVDELDDEVSDLKSAINKNQPLLLNGSYQPDWTNSYYSMFIKVEPGSKYKVTAPSSGTYMSGLRSVSSLPPSVGDTRDYSTADGWTSGIEINGNETKEGVLPNDVNYLYFYAGATTAYTRVPVSIVINGVDYLDSVFENMEVINSRLDDLESSDESINKTINDTTEQYATAAVTDDLGITSNGATIEKEDDHTIKIYGTSTKSRHIGFLNGQEWVKTSTSGFSKTLEAGTYHIESDIEGYADSYSIRGTYDTFDDYFNVVDVNNKNAIVTFEYPVMLAFYIISSRNYGDNSSEENATYISFSATKATAIDFVARNSTAEAIAKIQNYLPSPPDDYFSAEMSDTIEKVRNCITSPSIVFPVVTDMHVYSADTHQTFDKMINNIRYLVNEIKCDFLLNMGDSIDGNELLDTSLGYAYEITKKLKNVGLPYFNVNGNHDDNKYKPNSGTSGYDENERFDQNQLYQAFFSAVQGQTPNYGSNGTDYYFDIPGLNTRVIVLDSSRSSTISYTYGATTAEWLTNTAFDINKNIIISAHVSPIPTQVYANSDANKSTGVAEAITAFVNNGGKIIMLTGHSHMDIAFVSPWLSIMQVCQKFSVMDPTDTKAQRITGYIDDLGCPSRERNTETEDAWSVCIYKPHDNELCMIRFGAGVDRYFHATPISPTTVTTRLSEPTWSSSDDSVATVSNGVITGVSDGRCAVLAKDANGNYECWIVEIA